MLPHPADVVAALRRVLPHPADVVAALRHVLPHPADVVAALRTATVGWLALAVIAEAQSTGRRGHRRLLPKECDA